MIKYPFLFWFRRNPAEWINKNINADIIFEQDIKADLLQQIGAVEKHPFYRRDTFLNVSDRDFKGYFEFNNNANFLIKEQKHEEWMQAEEKRMQKIIKRIYRLSVCIIIIFLAFTLLTL